MPDIVEIGAGLDVITPTWTFIQDILNGPSTGIGVPTSCGKSGRDLQRALDKAGIKNWGHMVVKDTLLFRVRKPDAARAEQVLTGAVSGKSSGDRPQNQGDEKTMDTIADSLTKMKQRRGKWI